MARRTHPVTITAEGRDKGKTFFITEMPASQAEEWAARAISGMARSGTDIPVELMGSGMALLAAIGIMGIMRMRFEDLKPLLDEMFACVKFWPDPSNDIKINLIEEHIEEVTTRVLLREEVLSLHVNFSVAAEFQKLMEAARKKMAEPSPGTQT